MQRALSTPLITMLVVLIMASSMSAFAAEPATRPVMISLKHTPRGIALDLAEDLATKFGVLPGPHRLYSMEEWKELVIADNRITVLEEEHAALVEEKDRLLELEGIRAKEIETFKVDLATERAIADRVTKKWETCDGKLLRCKAGALWPWVAVGVSGVLAVAGGTALLVTLLQK